MTIVLIMHIVAMMLSLALMAGAVAVGLAGKRFAAQLSSYGMVATVVGGLSGGVLLLAAPLPIQCVELSLYLVAMTALYVFGFAMGDAEEARLIRSIVKKS
jgi:hypothetical protein